MQTSNCSCLLCESLLVKWTFLLLFLLEQYSEYEKVVIKEKEKREAEQEEEEELKAAIKVGFRVSATVEREGR